MMFCTKCGKEVPDDAIVCTGCGRSIAGVGNSVPNYLVQSIIATLFCCLPFGVVAIVYAGKVNTLVAAGDLSGAKEASARAKTWCWASLAAGAAVAILYIACMVFGLIDELGK